MNTRSDSKHIAAARVVNRMSSVINILQLKLDTITVISTKRIILYTLLTLRCDMPHKQFAIWNLCVEVRELAMEWGVNLILSQN